MPRNNVLPTAVKYDKAYPEAGEWGVGRFNVYHKGERVTDRVAYANSDENHIEFNDGKSSRKGKVVILPVALNADYALDDDYWPGVGATVSVWLDGEDVSTSNIGHASEPGGFVVVVKRDDNGDPVMNGDDFATERKTGNVEIRPKGK